MSYDEGKLPSEWKSAEIRAIPKHEKDAFRPITLLSCLDKLMEAVILDRIKYTQDPLDPHLFGFVNKKGCTDALTSLMAVISKATKVAPHQPAMGVNDPLAENSSDPDFVKRMRETLTHKNTGDTPPEEALPKSIHTPHLKDKPMNTVLPTCGNTINNAKTTNPNFKRQATFCIFLDLEKAFELARKDVIINALIKLKVGSKLLRWVKDFLTDREAHVKFQGEKSETKNFENGTPQGSLLSPTLFNAIINEVILNCKELKDIYVAAYADDLVIALRKGTTGRKNKIREAAKKIQKALDLVAKTCTELGLKINSDKTKAMAFGLHIQPNNLPTFSIGNEKLKWAKTFKYLGVILDHNLTFVPHARYLKAETKKKIGLLKSMAGSKWGCPTDTLLLFYRSHIRSKLEYGLPACLTMSTKAQRIIETIQNNCLRIALGARPDTSIFVLQAEGSCLPITDRMAILTLSFWIKLNHNFPENEDPETRHPLHSMTDEMELFSAQPALFGRTTWAKQLGLLIRKYWIQPAEPIQTEKLSKPWKSEERETYILTELPKAKNKCSADEIEAARAETEKQINLQKEDPTILLIFTDASVSDKGETSYGALLDGTLSGDSHRSEINLSGLIPLKTSTATAELHAIRMGIQKAHENLENSPHIKHIIIYTDSRSAYDILQQNPPKDNTLIHRAIKNMIRENNQISYTFQWVPSHIGICGNETADRLAEEGRQQPPLPIDYIPQSVSYRIAHLKRKAEANFIERAHAEGKKPSSSRGLKRYLDHNPEMSAPKRIKGSRQTEVITTALRASDLSKWVFRCKEPVTCGHCSKIFSAGHYMSECQDSAHLQRALYSSIPTPTLMYGTEEEKEREALKQIGNNTHELVNTLKHYPIKAKCPEGHPVVKKYGWMRCTNPFSKKKNFTNKENSKDKGFTNTPNKPK